MTTIRRRTFLMAAGAATAALTASKAAAQGAANNRLVIGVVGTGGMGGSHVGALAARRDVTVGYVCDVDSNRLATNAKAVESIAGIAPRAETDLRRVLDDKSVDAIFIVTPDHWHAPAAILALNVGKHVYVEKPCCHNIREGRLMADAVVKSGKLLQVGTQSRSTSIVREGIERLQKEEIGEVLVAKAWNSQRRGSIGKTQPSDPPAYLHFDHWVGPAPMVPYRSNLLPARWRWWYDFGCGDIGNDGVHDIDVACWGLGVTSHPTTVTCLGGKYFFDDDQQFPDTQYSVCEYAAEREGGRKKQLIFEQRIWSPYVQDGYENGAAFYGTQGMLLLGHAAGWKLYGPRNKLLAEKSGEVDLPAHHTNFFECIRGNQRQLNADIQAGLLAAGIVHLSNIAARVGRVLQFDPAREQIENDAEANNLLRRKYRDGHWAVPQGV